MVTNKERIWASLAVDGTGGSKCLWGECEKVVIMDNGCPYSVCYEQLEHREDGDPLDSVYDGLVVTGIYDPTYCTCDAETRDLCCCDLNAGKQ